MSDVPVSHHASRAPESRTLIRRSRPSDRRRAPFLRVVERIAGLVCLAAATSAIPANASAQSSSLAIAASHPLWADAGSAVPLGSVSAAGAWYTEPVATTGVARGYAYGGPFGHASSWRRGHGRVRVGVSCWTAVWDPWFAYWPACDHGWVPSFSFAFALTVGIPWSVYVASYGHGWYPPGPYVYAPYHYGPYIPVYHIPAYRVRTVYRYPPRSIYVVAPEPWTVREPVVRRPGGEIHNPPGFGTGGWVVRTVAEKPAPEPRRAVPRPGAEQPVALRPAVESVESTPSPGRPSEMRPSGTPSQERPVQQMRPATSGTTEPRATEVRTPEVRMPEVRMPEVRTSETRTPEMRTPETRTPEARTPEMRTPEARPPEVHTPEVRRTEVARTEVGRTDVRRGTTEVRPTTPQMRPTTGGDASEPRSTAATRGTVLRPGQPQPVEQTQPDRGTPSAGRSRPMRPAQGAPAATRPAEPRSTQEARPTQGGITRAPARTTTTPASGSSAESSRGTAMRPASGG